jgi:hypothetical protein
MDLVVENRLNRVQKYDRNLTIRHRSTFFFELLYACISGNFVECSTHAAGICHFFVSHNLLRCLPVLWKVRALSLFFFNTDPRCSIKTPANKDT